MTTIRGCVKQYGIYGVGCPSVTVPTLALAVRPATITCLTDVRPAKRVGMGACSDA